MSYQFTFLNLIDPLYALDFYSVMWRGKGSKERSFLSAELSVDMCLSCILFLISVFVIDIGKSQ